MAAEPFGAGCAAVPADGKGSFSGMATDPVATAASNNPVLSTLVTAVTEAGLGETLNSAKDITVFAPTNDAFAAVPKATMDAAMERPQGPAHQGAHQPRGRRAASPPTCSPVTTRPSPAAPSRSTGSGEDFTVGKAKVICGNVQTANATVYIIDGVLLPTS